MTKLGGRQAVGKRGHAGDIDVSRKRGRPHRRRIGSLERPRAESPGLSRAVRTGPRAPTRSQGPRELELTQGASHTINQYLGHHVGSTGNRRTMTEEDAISRSPMCPMPQDKGPSFLDRQMAGGIKGT